MVLAKLSFWKSVFNRSSAEAGIAISEVDIPTIRKMIRKILDFNWDDQVYL